MTYQYQRKFLNHMTIRDIDKELSEMRENEYRYSISIDMQRMWDLEYTKKVLEENEQKGESESC